MTSVGIIKVAAGAAGRVDDRDWADAARRGEARAGRQRGAALPGPGDRLARRFLDPDEDAVVWWLGAHGGAGESTLEELFSGSRAAGHSWPLAGDDRPPARVVLVARTQARGLTATQGAISDWETGDAHVVLLGVILIADRPGRLPAELRQLVDLISTAMPAVWRLPWIEAWRLGEPPAPHNAPNVVRRLLEDLRAMTSSDAPSAGEGLS